MGSIYKRGKKWYIDLTVSSRRIRKAVGTSKKLAELAVKDLELKAMRKELDLEITDTTLEKLFDEYATYSRVNHAPASFQRYQNAVMNFRIFLAFEYPHIKKISELSPTVFEKFKDFRLNVDPRKLKLPSGYPYKIARNALPGKSRTINYEVKTIRAIFNFGIKHGLCRDNPTADVPTLKVNDSQRPRFLDAAEIDRFLDAAPPSLYPIFYTFINTGLRKGELINLQWSDINLKRAKLSIRKKDFWVPKTKERDVPLHQGMIDLLKELKPKEAKPTDFVFGDDPAFLSQNLRKNLISIAKKAGIEDFTKIHSLRHTFASHLIMKGVDLPTVQRLLGHSDIQTTMIYAHLAPDHLVGAVEKLLDN